LEILSPALLFSRSLVSRISSLVSRLSKKIIMSRTFKISGALIVITKLGGSSHLCVCDDWSDYPWGTSSYLTFYEDMKTALGL
jgi:hypothetical protein